MWLDVRGRERKARSDSAILNRRSFRGNGGFFYWVSALAVGVGGVKEELNMASRAWWTVFIVLVTAGVSTGAIVDFEDLNLASESYWNGADGSGGFHSGGAKFWNLYNSAWGSWEGFAYSNVTDTATSGFAGQCSAIAGGGQGGSVNYGPAYVGWNGVPTVTVDAVGIVDGLYVTNTNYGYYSMRDGDMFAKKFGGVSGNDADWFLLTIAGKDANGQVSGTVGFYLADFRFVDNAKDYIVRMWEFVDLRSLGEVRSLEFSLSSSDTGVWGMNTPASFAIDTIVPEPVTWVLMGLGGVIVARMRIRQRGR